MKVWIKILSVYLHLYKLISSQAYISKGVCALVSDYDFSRQQAIDVLKACILLHADTSVTPNWYLKHHKGLDYLNMAMAQVTDNPAIADGSSIH